MNFRREQLAHELLDGLSTFDIPSGTLLIVSIPDGLDQTTTRMIGEAVNSALKAIGKDNPIILMPKEIGLQAVNEEDMKEMGYVRVAPSNAIDSRLLEPEACNALSGNIVKKHNFLENKTAEFARRSGKPSTKIDEANAALSWISNYLTKNPPPKLDTTIF